MEIIIKIPKEIYTGEQKAGILPILVDAIGKGIPLPEHHGRLGDLDALEKEIINGIKAGNYEEGYERYQNINNIDDCVECVRFADTIVEGSENV